MKPKPPQVSKPDDQQFKKLLYRFDQKAVANSRQVAGYKKSQQKTQRSRKASSQSLSERLSISEEDALRRQIEQCWNPPIGARDARSLVVDIKITVNPDRTVQSAEVVDKSRMATDSFYRAAGEAAIRAVNNPRCSPLQVPEGKYEQWKTIDFTFDPRDML